MGMAEEHSGTGEIVFTLPDPEATQENTKRVMDKVNQMFGKGAPEHLSAEDKSSLARSQVAIKLAYDNVMATLEKALDKENPPSEGEIRFAQYLLSRIGEEVFNVGAKGVVSESARSHLSAQFSKERAKSAGTKGGVNRREKRAWVAPFREFCIEKRQKNPSLSMSKLAEMALEAKAQFKCRLPGYETLKDHLSEMNKEGSLPPTVNQPPRR